MLIDFIDVFVYNVCATNTVAVPDIIVVHIGNGNMICRAYNRLFV